MATFSYSARNRAGELQQGSADAFSQNELVNRLRTQGLLVMEVKRQRSKGEPRSWSLNPFDYRSVRSEDIEHDFHQLAIMLRSGMTLLDAITVTAEFSRIGVRPVWLRIIDQIRQGNSFADALAQQKVFNNMTVQLVKVGEQTGLLDHVLTQASNELEKQRKLKQQLKSALTYPTVTIIFAIGVTIYMMVSIVPEIKKLLKMLGKPMPPITQALIDSSDWVNANIANMGIGVVFVIVTTTILYNIPISRLWMDTALLRVPLIGKVVRLSGTVAFANGLGLLLRSGVRIVEALETTEQLHNNHYLASLVATSRQRVMQGMPLAEPLVEQFGYMPLLPRMMVVGETSGNLDEMLQEMAYYHEEMLQRSIKKLTGMLGPAVTVLVGGFIGFVYAAFMVAMFSAAG